MRTLNAELLQGELGARGLTLGAFAQIAGVHRTTLSFALHGRRIRFETALALSRALDLVRAMPKLPGADRVNELAPSAPPRRNKRRGLAGKKFQQAAT